MKKGFSDELNKMLIMFARFRKDDIFIPLGVDKFRTIKEAQNWRMKLLRGHRPDCQC